MTAGLLQEVEIVRLLTRIGAEILMRRELGRIDEDAGDGSPGESVGAAHQRQVSVMQGAHGWDKSHRLAGAAPCVNPRAQRLYCADDPHLRIDGGCRHA